MERLHSLIPYGGEVYYLPGVFSSEQNEEYFRLLVRNISWKQEPIRLFGKEIMQPRLTAWYGDTNKPYTYSGITMNALEWIPPLHEIKETADALSGSVSGSALLNLYRDGNDGLGWHRDNEKMLGPTPVIASVSLGASRIFQIRNYQDKEEVVSVLLEPGSLLIMKGATQQNWEHRIPKTKKAQGARINITFRSVI